MVDFWYLGWVFDNLIDNVICYVCSEVCVSYELCKMVVVLCVVDDGLGVLV